MLVTAAKVIFNAENSTIETLYNKSIVKEFLALRN